MQFQLIRHGVVDSTNARALDAIEEGAARHGDVHAARGQTRGRGRLGRTWVSAADEGLYLSVVLLPPPPPLSPVVLTMATGLGVLAAVRVLGVEASLEWPNDVVVGPAKLAGILVEARGLDPVAPHHVVGVGLNVSQRSFPDELTAERSVTSLALQGVSVTLDEARERVLAELSDALESAFHDSAGLARDYLQELGCRGARVRVQAGARTLEGRLSDLTPEKGLRLVTEGGREEELALEHVSSLVPLPLETRMPPGEP